MYKPIGLTYLVLLLVFFFIAFGMEPFDYYVYDFDNSDFLKTGYYFTLVVPSLLLVVSSLCVLVFYNIIGAHEVKPNKIDEPENTKINFWKYCFFAILGFSLGIMLTGLIQYFIFSSNFYIPFRNSILEIGCTIALFIFLFSIIVASLISSAMVLRKKNKLFSIALISFVVLIYAIPFSLSIFIIDLIKVESTNNQQADVEQVEYGDAIEADAVADREPIEYEPGIKSYYDIDHENIATGSYFYDLWEDPQNDKRNTAIMIETYFNDYLIADQYKSLYRYRENYHFLIGDNINVELAKDKIDRKPEALLNAFSSYKNLLYAMLPKTVYEEYEFKYAVDLLICARNDIYRRENPLEDLNDIYSSMEATNSMWILDHFSSIKPFLSQQMKDIILNNVSELSSGFKEDVFYSGSGVTEDAIWAYSFWARRHKENNSDAVHQILTEIDNHYKYMESNSE